MKKSFIFICMMVSLSMSFSSLFSQSTGWSRAGIRNWVPANLNLTAEQIKKIETLQQNYLKETTPIQNDLTSKSLELRTLMVNPSADANKIMAKQKEIFTLRQKLQEIALKYRLDGRKILTPEQISLLPPGCGLGFALGKSYGMGIGGGRGFYGSQGKGKGRGYGSGAGKGRGMGSGRGICPFGWR